MNASSATNQSRTANVTLRLFATLIGIWLILPLAIIVPISFSGEDSFRFPPQTWTWSRYASLTDPIWLTAVSNSLTIGVMVAATSAILGVIASLGLVRSKSWLMAIMRPLILAPQVVPIIVFGLGLYLVFLRWNIAGTLLGFVIAHTVLALPFVVIPVSASLQTFDKSLERASASLGASALTTFFRVTFPIIRPAILSGTFLAFLSSFDELVLALFLKSPSFFTLPVLLYRHMTDNIDPTVAAVATIELLLVSVCVIVALILKFRAPDEKQK